MRIITKVQKAAESRGIKTQKELIERVKERTGTALRPATVSEIYSDHKVTINREFILLIARALDITDIGELIELIDDGKE